MPMRTHQDSFVLSIPFINPRMKKPMKPELRLFLLFFIVITSMILVKVIFF